MAADDVRLRGARAAAAGVAGAVPGPRAAGARVRARAADRLRRADVLDRARGVLPRHRRHAHAARRGDRRGGGERRARLRPRARSPRPAAARRRRRGHRDVDRGVGRCRHPDRRVPAPARASRVRDGARRAAPRRHPPLPLDGRPDRRPVAARHELVRALHDRSSRAWARRRWPRTSRCCSLLSMSFMQAIGIGLATTTLVGRYKGAKDLASADAQLPLGDEARGRPRARHRGALRPRAGAVDPHVHERRRSARARASAARARRRVPALRRARRSSRAARCAARATRAGRSSCRRDSRGWCACRWRGCSR